MEITVQVDLWEKSPITTKIFPKEELKNFRTKSYMAL